MDKREGGNAVRFSGKRFGLKGLCTIWLETNLRNKQPCCFSGCQTQLLKEGTCRGHITHLPADAQYLGGREPVCPATAILQISVSATGHLTHRIPDPKFSSLLTASGLSAWELACSNIGNGREESSRK